MKYLIKLLFTLLVLLLLLFSGCNDVDSENKSIPEVKLVTTKVGFNPVFYPLENNKIFSPEGVDIKLLKASYTQAELYTLSENENLVGILSFLNLANSKLRGEEFKVLAPYYREIVGPEGYSMGRIAAKKNSGIVSVKDLEGKRIGIQGFSDGSTLLFINALHKSNVDIDSIDFVPIESELAPLLVQKGDLEAAMFDSDYLVASDFDENFESVFDFGKYTQDYYGSVPPAKFFVVKKTNYDLNPKIFDVAVQYFSDNYMWSRNNLELITKLESISSGEDYNILLMKAEYEVRLDSLKKSDIEIYQDIYEMAYEYGILDSVPKASQIFKNYEINYDIEVI